MGKWTKAGFEANTLNSYKLRLQQAFVNAFGSDFLVDDALPQGVLIQELAEILYAADMDGVEALSRMNLNTATGIYLDLIGNLRGIRRTLGTSSQVSVRITSNANSLPYTLSDSIVFTCNDTGEQFTPVNPVNINEEVTTIALESVSAGKVATALNNTMSVPVNNVLDVLVTAVAQGADTEEDLYYRNRIINNYTVANNTIQSIENLILSSGVAQTVGAEYNDSDSEIGGISAHATEFLVVPIEGIDESLFKDTIGKIILDNKCPGSPTSGNTSVETQDLFGKTKTVNFTIPTRKEIEIEVSVSTPETTGVLDLSNKDSIANTIKSYIDSLGIGKDVSYARCIAPLASDTGFDIISFKMRSKGDDVWAENTNYVISAREYATIELSDIKIGV